jgi:hypothetical protein
MFTRNRWVLLGLILALTMTGMLVASNVGFTIVRQLKAADGGVQSLTGKNSLALPYRTRNNLTMASELLNDIGAPNVVSIQKYDPATDSLVTYTDGGTDFPLVAGEGYFVNLSSDVSYRIFGSHDPSVIIPLKSAANPESVSGINLISLPYHATSATASELFAEIGLSNVLSIARYVESTDSFHTYSLGASDFSLEKGVAYQITVPVDTSFVPNHF